jgi:hexosaminidase
VPCAGEQAGAGLAVLLLAAAAAAGPGAAMSADAVQRPVALGEVIPKPVRVRPAPGAFEVVAGTRIVVRGGAAARAVADELAGVVRGTTGLLLPVVSGRGTTPGGAVELRLDPALASLAPEGYRLRIAPRGVTLAAPRSAGLFYGVQTLRQLLPASAPARLPAGSIEDRPRFAWRGAMLDVARHFFGPADVRRLVDLMAFYKLNRLHLHLTDDQGWRLAIRSWPRLARHGGRTQVGGGPGGSYTQRQYADLVAHAARRHVTVVPEVDLPGHTNAALAAYARLNCDGVARDLYTGIEVGFSSLCLRKELTYGFVDDVLGELAALTPGPYLHVGGDEALSTPREDYVRFMRRVQDIVRAHGKRMIGWEETARAALHRTSVVQHWHDGELARAAVARGAKLIMSPATKAYLDMKYDPGTALGLTWAGTTSVRDAYAWDPATVVQGIRERDVLGVEAPLWSETTTTVAELDFLAFPRLLGHAEIGWSPARGRSWGEYRRRLGAHGPLLRRLGVAFHPAPGIPWR